MLTGGGQAEHLLAVMADERSLVVPVITISEVFKRVLREHGEAQAIQAAASMQSGQVVDFDNRLALAAAQLSPALQLRLRTASSWPPPGITRPGCTRWTAISAASPMWSEV